MIEIAAQQLRHGNLLPLRLDRGGVAGAAAGDVQRLAHQVFGGGLVALHRGEHGQVVEADRDTRMIGGDGATDRQRLPQQRLRLPRPAQDQVQEAEVADTRARGAA